MNYFRMGVILFSASLTASANAACPSLAGRYDVYFDAEDVGYYCRVDVQRVGSNRSSLAGPCEEYWGSGVPPKSERVAEIQGEASLVGSNCTYQGALLLTVLLVGDKTTSSRSLFYRVTGVGRRSLVGVIAGPDGGGTLHWLRVKRNRKRVTPLP